MGTELAIGLLLLGTLYSQPSIDVLPVAYAAEPLVEIPQQSILKPAPPKIPSILEEVARCESGGRQFLPNGKVVRGKIDPRDIGKWQINTYWWGKEAQRLGHDIFTESGNTAMALHIYKTEGLKPWRHSKHCWGV